jgi:hypothetical protein
MRRGILSAAVPGLLLLVSSLTSCPSSQESTVPALAGLELSQAEAALTGAGLRG